MNESNFDIGNKIRSLRKEHGYTMIELAEKLSITQPQLSRIENNVNLIQLDTLRLLCSIFNITLSEFFYEAESKTEISDVISELNNLSSDQLKALKDFIKSMKKQ
jgi:transcriptional regulator with XRE-family HTH domain